MLFNTLTYAKFLGLVFVVVWTLVHRRWVPLLPWFALAGYAVLGAPSPVTLSVAAVGFALTRALCREPGGDRPPTLAVAGAASALNLGALAWLTFRARGVDPLTLALAGIDFGLPRGAWASASALAVTLVGAVAVLRARRVRLLFLLGASYVFYAHWDWHFLPLIMASSSVDWWLGSRIGRERRPAYRKLWLIATVVLNLGVLAVFKYFDFGIESARAVLGALGLPAPEVTLRLALPVGISFFTFESMSYVIDVYRGDLQPHPSYLEYLAFVAYFPHLVAGPIIRPRDLLPQLASAPRFSAARGSEGLFLVATGLSKKVIIGDYLAVNLVDRVFDAPAQFSALECYAAVVGYALQIYCDFSGYTDIAIGSARLLGIEFPLNFDAPYKAVDIQDFWRRWHISLSSWLRDYLYIPLGGNRHGTARTYVNLMLTMLLGGLWHGANWTFVVWGGLHGAGLAINRAWQRARGPRARPLSPLGRAWRVAFCFHFVCVAWIFFRADTFQKAWSFFVQLGTRTTFHPNLGSSVLAVLALGLLSHWAPERWFALARERFVQAPAPAQGLLLFAVALAIREMAGAEAVPFVYFQF